MSHTLSRSQTIRVGGKTVGATNDVTDGALASIDEVCPIGTDVEHEIAFPYAKLKGLVLSSAVACTIKTNSSSAPDETFTLAAGRPIVWMNGDVSASPVTADVTSVFITNAAEGLIQIFALYDPT